MRDGIKHPRVHRFPTSGEAYNASQTSDDIRDGDVLSVPEELVVGVLIEAWPVAIGETTGEFHEADPLLDWNAIKTTASDYKETQNYSESFRLAIDELNHICMEASKKKWDEQDYQGFYNTYPLRGDE